MEPKSPAGKANRLLNFWRNFGPGSELLDLEKLFFELILQMSGGDRCTIVYQPLESVEGVMLYDGENDSWRIGVNSKIESVGRKRFTLAHEIGHFVLHRSKDSDFRCSYTDMSDYYKSPLEMEANEFASFLLMPADIFREFAKGEYFNSEVIKRLSDRFGVSKEAASYRVLKLSSRKKLAFIKSRDGFVISSMVSHSAYKSGIYFKKDSEIPQEIDDGSQIDNGSFKDIDGVLESNRSIEAFAGQIARSTTGDFIYHYIEFE